MSLRETTVMSERIIWLRLYFPGNFAALTDGSVNGTVGKK